MAINLVKGQRVGIDNSLSRLKVEMGWNVNSHATPPYDLDASTFLMGKRGQIEHEYDFVFYGSQNKVPALDENGIQLVDKNGNPLFRPCSVDKSVLGSIDDLGDNDDTGKGNEEIDIDLTKTSLSINEILFTVSIYWNPNDSKDPRRKYNFGQVRDAYIQIKNAITGETICRYDLDEDFSTDKGVEFGRLYRRAAEWKFQAVGEGHEDGLKPIVRKYASKFM